MNAEYAGKVAKSLEDIVTQFGLPQV